MAHTVCGIDSEPTRSSSRFLEVGFRKNTLRGVMETAVPAGDAPLLERQMMAVREGLSQLSGEVTPYIAASGDQLSMRVLELPFTDQRKIDQVIGYELEADRQPHRRRRVRSPGGRAAAGGLDGDGGGGEADDLAALIGAAETQGIHPRAIYAAPVTYRTLFPAARARRATAPRSPATWCSTSGTRAPTSASCTVASAIYARTIRRGGEASDRGNRQGVRRRHRTRRAGQTQRGVPRSARAGRRRRRWRPSWTACCARR